MHKRHILAPAVILFLLAQIATATTTVTLTGTCPVPLINQSSNYLLFNISNSGDGAATDLMLVPLLEGATTPNSTITIPLVAPGGRYTAKFYMQNFTEPGSYAEYIRASYSQGSSTFVTVFPCLVNITEKAQSLVRITGMNHTGSKLSVTAVNLAGYPIDTNVIVQAPPMFVIRPDKVPIHLNPNGQSIAVFNLSVPDYTGAQFPVVAAISYSNSSVHYATASFEVISFAAASAASSGTPTVTMGIVVVIIILALLILVSFVRKERPKQPQQQEPEPQVPAHAVGAETPKSDSGAVQ